MNISLLITISVLNTKNSDCSVNINPIMHANSTMKK